MVHKVYRSSAPGLHVAAYDELSAFKIHLVDVGLLRRLAQLAPTAFGEDNRLFTESKGALTENFVLQTLVTQFEVLPRNWTQNNPPYEVDFLISSGTKIKALEVKSSGTGRHESITKFREKYSNMTSDTYIVSQKDVSQDENIKFKPVYMIDFLMDERT